MEICTKTLDGLSILGNSVLLPDACFTTVINSFYDSILNKDVNFTFEDNPATAKLDSGALKQAHAAFATFILEAAKHDCDQGTMSNTLEDCKFPSDRIDEILKTYSEHKPALQVMLSNITFSPPHIVDASWKLSFVVKDKHTEKVNEAEYLINLKTEEVGSDQPDTVQFACSQEQLQDLVGKLKDACKCLEKTAQH